MKSTNKLNINNLQLDDFIVSLTSDQKKYILEKLKVAVFGNLPQEITKCPCCNSDNFIKKGSYKDKQKYKCRNTSKIFSYKTATIISGVWNLNKLEQLMDLMVSGKFPTLDEIQEKIGISRQTALDWRNKIITALYKEVSLDNQVIEFDETFFRISKKGRKGMMYSRKRGKKRVGDNQYNVKVFMAYSRSTGKLELFQSHMGKTSAQDVENYLGTKKSIVVYSDRHVSYKSYYKKRRVLHSTFKAKTKISKWNKAVHNQTLNYYSGALANFLDETLHGVSTKYLQGYLNWFMFIENCKKETVSVKNAVVENKVALDIFKQKEKEFQYFLRMNGRNNYGTFKDRYYGRKRRAA
jgi:transposase-like protein